MCRLVSAAVRATPSAETQQVRGEDRVGNDREIGTDDRSSAPVTIRNTQILPPRDPNSESRKMMLTIAPSAPKRRQPRRQCDCRLCGAIESKERAVGGPQIHKAEDEDGEYRRDREIARHAEHDEADGRDRDALISRSFIASAAAIRLASSFRSRRRAEIGFAEKQIGQGGLREMATKSPASPAIPFSCPCRPLRRPACPA